MSSLPNATCPMPAAAPREPIPGYVLRERLGAGGYGEVWKADAPGGLFKAVKIVFGHLSDARAARELKALERIKQIRHPMLLSLERIELVDEQLVVVTELADMSLRDRFNEHRRDGHCGIPRDELLQHLCDAADGLDYLFERHSLQHLDVKPENLLLVGGRVKVADFGLVKDLHDTNVSIVGGLTPLYAPPELFEGRPNRHSDQYSLAVMYQELLTGKPPFDGRTPAQIAIQQMQGAPDLALLPRLDQPVIARALSKNPDQRYHNCRALVDHLRDVAKKGSVRPRSIAATGVPAFPSKDGQSTTVATASVFANSGNRASELPLPNQIRVLPPLSVEGISSALRPTLFIGLGGTAIKLIAEIRERLTERQCDTPRVPCFRFLAVDTDADDLNRTVDGRHVHWGMGEWVHLPLRTGTEYRERSGRLLEWLGRRWLFNIPRSMKTEGIRPLGRLAFVDHCERVQSAIAQALHVMREEASVRISSESTQREVQANAPRVVIVGHVGGGTASGSIFDLACAARTEMARCQQPDCVELLLIHSTPRRSGARDLALANTLVHLRELCDMLQSPQGYPGEPNCGIPAFETSRVAPARIRLVHLGDDLDEFEYRDKVKCLGDYLARETAAPAADLLARLNTGTETARTYATIESLGLRSLTGELGALPRKIAAHVANQTMESWFSQPLPVSSGRKSSLAELDEILSSNVAVGDEVLVGVTSGVFRALKLDKEDLIAAVRNDAHQLLGEAPELYWNRIFDRVLDPATGHSRGADVALTIRRIVGHADASECQGSFLPLESQLLQVGGQLGEQRAGSLQQCLSRILDVHGPRVHSALELARSIRQRIGTVGDELQKEITLLNAQLTEGLQRATAADSTGKPTRGDNGTTRRREAWLAYARCEEHWAILRGVEAALLCVQAMADELLQQLTEFARRVRQIASLSVPLPEERDWSSDALELRDWALASVSQWVVAVDQQLDQRFLESGLRLSQLLTGSEKDWDGFSDTIQEVACRTVMTSILDRTLTSASDSDEIDHNASQLAMLVKNASPKLVASGGLQQWSIIASETDHALCELLQGELEAALGQRATCLTDVSGDLLVCCHMSAIPVENTIRGLLGDRDDLIEIADRLHARIDVEWSPIIG